MSTLEALNALNTRKTIDSHVFNNATSFVHLVGDKLSGLGQPKVHSVHKTLVIEWLTKDTIWSVDFEDDDACAMIYFKKTDTQDESSLLCESANMQDLVDFLEKHYQASSYVQEQE